MGSMPAWLVQLRCYPRKGRGRHKICITVEPTATTSPMTSPETEAPMTKTGTPVGQDTLAPAIARYVPLGAWVIVIMTVILIPSKIISYGYLPQDDALRHAAKAVSGKPWSEILVRSEEHTSELQSRLHLVCR